MGGGEMQLTGEYQHSLDAKGRFNFSAKLREILGDHLMVSKGLGDDCLAVYSMEEWDKLSEKVTKLPIAKAKRLQRFLFSGAFMAEPDKQGRILLPQNLREYAGLTKDIVVIGVGDRAEIWDKEKWEQSVSEMTAELIEEDMCGLDF